MALITIPFDHGNKLFKTENKAYIAGLKCSDVKPLMTQECIRYNGKFYTLTKDRIPYRRDKTEDERTFILSLFGIAHELKALKNEESGPYDLNYLIGLPPAHYSSLYEQFENYFKRKNIQFYYNGEFFTISFENVISYPQAYAALMTIFDQIKDMPKAYVIDIGGYTLDYLLIRYGQADLSVCDSLEYGAIPLYNKIKSAANAELNSLPDEIDIENIIGGKEGYKKAFTDIVAAYTEDYINDIINNLRERKLDINSVPVFFVGGVASLFMNRLQQVLDNATFIQDINANLKGYRIMNEKGL